MEAILLGIAAAAGVFGFGAAAIMAWRTRHESWSDDDYWNSQRP